MLLVTDAPGVGGHDGRSAAVVALHVGQPVRLTLTQENRTHVGLAIHGDVDLTPAGVPAHWELRDPGAVLAIAVAPALLTQVAESLDIDASRVELRNRAMVRDPHLEHIGWALKTEVEQDYPGTGLYLDSLATAVAVRLLKHHSSLTEKERLPKGRLPEAKLRQVLTYIEEHLHKELRLFEIAASVCLSVSHLKVLFRESVGMPIHQYVIRRRIDRAMLLLEQGRLSISQVAAETGFAHQSHLSAHMRRIVGLSPGEFRRSRTSPLREPEL